MSVRVRFAPSPTGPLHIGGARTALFNFLFAKQQGGTFILRIDDTDRERSLKELEQGIIDGLQWLGLDWQEGPERGGHHGPYWQVERIDTHLRAAEQLLSSDKAYRDSEGVVRLRYPRSKIVVNDLVCGECEFEAEALGPEPVILRSNGTPTYHLASVSDDIEMKITHVIRGADHLTNTAKQQVIFESLGREAPRFAHLPLLLGKDGGKLSKRNSDALVSLKDFREQGYVAEAVVNFLLLLGWSHPEEQETLSLAEALKSFSLERVGKTGALFDTTKLEFLNGWWIRHLAVDDLAKRMKPFAGIYQAEIEARGQAYWEAAVGGLREWLPSLIQTEDLCSLLMQSDRGLETAAREELANSEAFHTFAKSWLALLEKFPPAPDSDCYSEGEFKQLTQRIKKELGVKGKELFRPLRAMVTGQLSGPELGIVAQFIRYEDLKHRAETIVDGL